jgi:SsrA-binding protein
MAGGIKIIAQNRRARHDFIFLETIEAGLVLTGTEIKSIRDNKVNLRGSHVSVRDGEMWLMNANIAEYTHGNRENHEPTRPRKLLLHRREINRLSGKLQGTGLTLIPTKLYLKRGRAKVEIALARGKKKYDKRADLAKRDSERKIERALKRNSW